MFIRLSKLYWEHVRSYQSFDEAAAAHRELSSNSKCSFRTTAAATKLLSTSYCYIEEKEEGTYADAAPAGDTLRSYPHNLKKCWKAF